MHYHECNILYFDLNFTEVFSYGSNWQYVINGSGNSLASNRRQIITMMSQWARWRLKSPASRLFTQPFIRAQIKVNIKAPRQWPLCGEFTGAGEFPAQMASYAENVSIRWRHHVITWSNEDRDHWRIYAALWGAEITGSLMSEEVPSECVYIVKQTYSLARLHHQIKPSSTMIHTHYSQTSMTMMT